MSNESTLYRMVYDNMMRLLVDDKITIHQVEEQIELLLPAFSAIYPDEVLDKEQLAKRIINDYGIFEGPSRVLQDNTDHKEWLAEERASIEWNLWNRYVKYLGTKKNPMPPSAIEGIDESTEKVLKRLESPRRKGNWDRRGMVVGNVQSGKTANYTGLICKAVDAGYKVIIVLAGLNNDLRSQTQKRIDKDFLGRNTSKKKDRDQTSSRIGAGLIPGFKIPAINAVTSADAGGDYKKKVHENVMITPGSDPVIAVVKKNVTPLKNLYSWFSDINNSGRIANVPLLLIDDEADNASVDTKALKLIDESNPDASEQDPTKINGFIRKILNCFEQSAYVGYTATPFANIFIYPIDPENAKKEYGEDLFPRSFIVNLEAPSNYIGPEKVFGLYSDKVAGIEEVKPLPLIRETDDYDKIFPEKHNKDLIINDIPDSLRQAIYAFILSAAARDVRGQGNDHHSMLIHVTRYVKVQNQLVDQLKDEMKIITEQLEFRTGPKYEKLIADLEKLWNEDFSSTTKAVMEAMPHPDVYPISWEKINEKLYTSASKIEVKAVNGKAADGGIDYDSYPNGCKVIAVGGDKLSRGLTLEGLAVSYYSRLAKTYDTLLQMGRWFGYRDGYADLCRLYTSPKLVGWYRDIAVANEELRKELNDMAEMNAKPDEYGLKVRTHPDGMLITALNKMRNSEERAVTYADSLLQITRFFKNNDVNKANIRFVDNWLSSLGIPKKPSQATNNNYVWEGKFHEKIVDFINGISIHPTCASASPKVVSSYILSQVGDNELTDWTVALVSTNTGERKTIAGQEIGLSWRTDDSANRGKLEADMVYLINNNLVSEKDLFIDLTEEEYRNALKETKDHWVKSAKSPTPPVEPSPSWVRKCKDKKKGLLLIYPFKSGKKDNKEITETYEDVYLGYAIVFPASETAREVKYKVDEVYLRYEHDE